MVSNSKNSANNSNDNNFDNGTFSFGRFPEFTASDGNIKAQNELVREVLWQATCQSTSESMDSTIQSHLNATSEILSDLYTKSERDNVERNQRLAIETSLPDISKWNKQLMDGTKASKQHRMEISKELALVDALLKRTTRRQRMSGALRFRRQRTRTSQNANDLDSSGAMLTVGDVVDDAAVLSTVVSSPKGLVFTLVVCTFALESFDTITSHEGGASRLANYAAFSTFLILSIAYLNTLRAALHKAHLDLNRQTGKGRSNRL